MTSEALDDDLPVRWLEDARQRLGDLLLAAGVISERDLVTALEAQLSAMVTRRRLGHVLVDLGMATEREIAESIARQLGLEVVDLSKLSVAPEVVRTLPHGVARRLGLLVVARDGSRLTIAASDPTDVVAFDDVRLHTGASELTVKVATESQVRAMLARAWSLTEDSADVATLFDSDESPPPEPDDAAVDNDDAPTVRVVTRMLADAVRAGASDIHVEPQVDGVRIRYRVDGLLREVMSLPRSALASVVSRLKIVSGLDIAERRVPQDGRTRISVDGHTVDTRVSTMPSINGEKVVVRLLTRSDNVPRLDETGLDHEQLEILRRATQAAQGLVLLTGPTGSGKTNTLYSALAEIHTPERNVITLEDPVEIQVPGTTQVQVNERTGLTFSRGLRAVLRQDPDVVLVGEVRDTETAGLAIRAASTGHLVLTTLHTNSAVAAVSRLVEMGIEPFMLSALSAVVAQRLVRRPCSGCLVDDDPDPQLLAYLGVDSARLEGASPKRGAGCGECGDTGYRGRIGVFEVLAIDQEIHRVLAGDATEAALREATRGMTTLRDSAVAHALAGVTTFDEVARISPSD